MLLPWFQALESSALGEAIRNSHWLFPVIEVFHLLGLAVIGGAVLIVDFRLLGLGLRSHPVSRLAHDMQPWVIGSLIVMVASGVPLFVSEAIKCYYSVPFWVKMTALAAAVVFTFTIRRSVVMADRSEASLNRIVAGISIGLWATVGWGGRWIAFL